MPATQDEHSASPAADAKEPGTQSEQEARPLAFAIRPAAQGVQDARPSASAKLPMGQALHAGMVALANVPAAHAAQTPLAFVAKPGLHGEHTAASDGAPALLEGVVPVAHFAYMQDTAPLTFENVPGEQSEHTSAPEVLEKEPGRHAVHKKGAEPDGCGAAKVPGGHSGAELAVGDGDGVEVK